MVAIAAATTATTAIAQPQATSALSVIVRKAAVGQTPEDVAVAGFVVVAGLPAGVGCVVLVALTLREPSPASQYLRGTIGERAVVCLSTEST